MPSSINALLLPYFYCTKSHVATLTLKRDVLNLDLLGIPLSEKLDGAGLWSGDGSDVLWNTVEAKRKRLRL